MLNDVQEYEVWKYTTLRFLEVNFTDDRCIKDFEIACNNFRLNIYKPQYIDKIIGILKSCAKIPAMPQKEVKPTTTIDKSVNINVNQSQEQTQSQEVAINIFHEAIKDEITGNQFKELKYIAHGEPNPEKAKSKILDKIKSWGESVSASIITNILINPTIWSGLMQICSNKNIGSKFARFTPGSP